MGAIASQITSLAIVYSAFYSGADQRKHQSSASLAFVRGIHRGPVNSPHKWPETRKMFPFDDVIMIIRFTSWQLNLYICIFMYLFRIIVHDVRLMCIHFILNILVKDNCLRAEKHEWFQPQCMRHELNNKYDWLSDHIVSYFIIIARFSSQKWFYTLETYVCMIIIVWHENKSQFKLQRSLYHCFMVSQSLCNSMPFGDICWFIKGFVRVRVRKYWVWERRWWYLVRKNTINIIDRCKFL